MRVSRLFSKHSSTLFFLIAGLGFAISSLVYLRGEQILEAMQDLVNEELPVFDELRLYSNAMIEQERILYEYYATEQSTLYTDLYLTTQANADKVLTQLQKRFPAEVAIQSLIATNRDIESIADTLFVNLNSDRTDWDLARLQLAEISNIRREALPLLNRLLSVTEHNVATKQQIALQNVQNVRALVIAYSFAIALLIFIFARAINAYVNANNERERLAVFPQRTPNALISLNTRNKVIFSNPACQRLMAEHGITDGELTRILPDNLAEQQQIAQQSEDDFHRFEYILDGRTYECELHWIDAQREWDLHISDISDKKIAEQELQYQAAHHPESGLLNEYQMQADLKKHLAGSDIITIGIIQLRRFSDLKTSIGSQAASELTKEVGVLYNDIINALPDLSIQLFHLGEHTFAFVAAELMESDRVTVLMDLFEHALRQSQHALRFQLDYDAGIAYSHEGIHSEDLIRNANIALEKAIESDASSWIIFSASLGQQVETARQLVADLRHAITHSSFELYFQPQARLSDKRIVGVEVLIRWFKDGKFISPAEFIPLAEQSGLIIPLGDWILFNACQQGVELFRQTNTEFTIAVNISAIQFSQSDFVDKVQKALEMSGLPAHLLELEITESATMHNELDTIAQLHGLHDLGVMLAIDDFGTGYSSLSYLSRFPLHKLKIDQSFVRHLLNDKGYLSIVHSVIELGKSLNLSLIAEGVEEAQQAQLLADLGCHEMQGYWYSKPLPFGELVNFVGNQNS